MGIIYSADVFCDACGKWTHGTTGSEPPSRSKAFRLRDDKSFIKVGTDEHYCADCAPIIRDQAAKTRAVEAQPGAPMFDGADAWNAVHDSAQRAAEGANDA